MAVAGDAVRIDGLAEFQAALRRMDSGLPRQLRLMLNDAAQLVVHGAQPLVARRSGRAAGSIKAASQQRVARVKAGGAAAPYYAWLDFGGAVGRRNSVHRPWVPKGRYLYPAYRSRKPEIVVKLNQGVRRLAEGAGVRVG